MCHAETLPRQSLQKITGNRFLGSKCNGMDKTIQSIPLLAQRIKKISDVIIACYITRKHEIHVEILCQLLHTLLDVFTSIGKSQLSSFALQCFGNTVGNGTIG